MNDTLKSIYMRFPEGRAKALTFSYDDGMTLDPKLVALFNRYGMKATFNISSGLFFDDTQTPQKNPIYQRMTEEETLATFANTPHEIAVHGYSHCDLASLPSASVVREVLNDRENLETMFGTAVRGMAYPYGTYNDTVIDAVRACGIAYARTVDDSYGFDIPKDWLRLGATCHQQSPRLMELAEKFLEEKPARDSKLFYLWGHSYEFGEMGNWDVIERFCEYMSGRESEIWYATNLEIYEYIEDFGRLIFSVDNSIVHNPTNRTLFFSAVRFRESELFSIAPGETLKLTK